MQGPYAGTCLNVGCIPSKASTLLSSSPSSSIPVFSLFPPRDLGFWLVLLRQDLFLSSALLHSSHMYHEANHSFPSHGVKFSQVEVDLAAMMAQKDKAVSNLTRGIEGLNSFKVSSLVPAFGYQWDPRVTSGYLIACSVKGPSFRAGSARLVPKTSSEWTTLPHIRHLAANYAFEHQVPSSGVDYRAAGLAHQADYLLGTFRPGGSKRPFIPSQQL
ncbi:hypothetical protein Taro_045151 [Colocasia esculenta]|uniref:Uncharacterized protein n=1 Tax=Colocasia esculenta TaxID=4460 RepID=A0A843WZN4_COLES|nr:hypothetical protein [Colocasia esculenta]